MYENDLLALRNEVDFRRERLLKDFRRSAGLRDTRRTPTLHQLPSSRRVRRRI